jgi:hypothetical protein
MNGKARSAFHRTKRMAVAVGAVSALTMVVTDPGSASPAGSAAPVQEAAFGAGTGTAIAIAYKVNPVFGNLSFGITAGESVAGHQNTAAQGQSKAVNLGVIGVTLAGEGCEGAEPTLAEKDQPQPVVVSSDDPGAEQGRRADLLGAITMFARATKAPFSEVVTTVAPVGDAGLVLISGGTSKATSGLVAPGQREARAVTELAAVRLLATPLFPNGLIQLGDLRWEAIQRTGKVKEDIGHFSLGSLTVAGQRIPLPTEGLEQLAVLNDTLSALGLELALPKVRVAQGIVFVDPMKIGIIPADLRDGVIGPLLAALQPQREDVTQLLADLGCGSENDVLGNNGKTAITVLDLALGTISGAGRLSVELGGVQATTADITGFDGLGVLPPLPDLGGALPDLGGAVPDLGSGGGFDGGAIDVTTPPAIDTGGDGSGSGAPTPTQAIAALDGDRGGAMLAVGAGGLLLLLATAEGDRRKMLRAQREIPLEA